MTITSSSGSSSITISSVVVVTMRQRPGMPASARRSLARVSSSSRAPPTGRASVTSYQQPVAVSQDWMSIPVSFSVLMLMGGSFQLTRSDPPVGGNHFVPDHDGEPAGKLSLFAGESVQPSAEVLPKHGTLAWLQAQEQVSWYGLQIPACHRITADCHAYPEVDGKCRVVRPGGDRCGATATRLYGICMAHAGGGGMFDPGAMSAAGHAAKLRLKRQRVLLGI